MTAEFLGKAQSLLNLSRHLIESAAINAGMAAFYHQQEQRMLCLGELAKTAEKLSDCLKKLGEATFWTDMVVRAAVDKGILEFLDEIGLLKGKVLKVLAEAEAYRCEKAKEMYDELKRCLEEVKRLEDRAFAERGRLLREARR